MHAACGTGKTIIAAAAAKRIAPKGRVLVLVPTLDLLTQTVRAWRAAGHKGPAVAVCSLHDDPELWTLKVRCTTNPIQLSLWHGDGPVTIYPTYASLSVLAEAFEGAYGQQLAPMDLVCVDEGHRTSGSMGKTWADVHDQEIIPAARRLYMTATPRIWQERAPHWQVAEGVRDALPEKMAASMDDEEIFGPILYKPRRHRVFSSPGYRSLTAAGPQSSRETRGRRRAVKSRLSLGSAFGSRSGSRCQRMNARAAGQPASQAG